MLKWKYANIKFANQRNKSYRGGDGWQIKKAGDCHYRRYDFLFSFPL